VFGKGLEPYFPAFVIGLIESDIDKQESQYTVAG